MPQSQITPQDVGLALEVCGRVVEAGEKPCPECQYGSYMYMRLDGGFLIITEWFMYLYPGRCISAFDEVDFLEAAHYPTIAASEGDGIPIFRLSPADIYEEGCTIGASGNTVCEQRPYLASYDRCE